MPNKSANLHRARAVRNDEFYTQMCDIENECQHYLTQFRDKVIYCNCDTEQSNFVKYFQRLKTAGHVKDVLYSGGADGLDFRSPESIALLKQADIVITNPPFSLFREHIGQLIEHNKQFLIIGGLNALSYKDIVYMFKENKLWLGFKPMGAMKFNMPDTTEQKAIPAVWFTNIKHNKPIRDIPLHKTYNPIDYPKYDNANAINVNRIKDIPVDYDGVMGVPITFLDKYNPEQFILLGRERDFNDDRVRGRINGKHLYARLFIKRLKKCPKAVYNDNVAGYYTRPATMDIVSRV